MCGGPGPFGFNDFYPPRKGLTPVYACAKDRTQVAAGAVEELAAWEAAEVRLASEVKP